MLCGVGEIGRKAHLLFLYNVVKHSTAWKKNCFAGQGNNSFAGRRHNCFVGWGKSVIRLTCSHGTTLSHTQLLGEKTVSRVRKITGLHVGDTTVLRGRRHNCSAESRKLVARSNCSYGIMLSHTELPCGVGENGGKIHLQLLLLQYNAVAYSTALTGREKSMARPICSHGITLSTFNSFARSAKLVARPTCSYSTSLSHI